MAKMELPESWTGVAEPLRALIAEIEREAHAHVLGAAGPRGRVGAVGAGERRDPRGSARADP